MIESAIITETSVHEMVRSCGLSSSCMILKKRACFPFI